VCCLPDAWPARAAHHRGAVESPRRRSAECSLLDHDRSRRWGSHHGTAFTARTTRRAARRLVHRSTAGGLAGLRLRGRTGCGASHARRAELHERRATAAVRAAETTAATRGDREAAEGDHEAQGTAHGCISTTARPETTRSRTRCVVRDDACQTLAHDPRRGRTVETISAKNFPAARSPRQRPCRWDVTVAIASAEAVRQSFDRRATLAETTCYC